MFAIGNAARSWENTARENRNSVICTRVLRIAGENYELLEKATSLRRSLLALGGRIPTGDGASLCRAFAPVGAQFPNQVERARHEHDVARTGELQGGFESFAGIAGDDGFFGIMAGDFS